MKLLRNLADRNVMIAPCLIISANILIALSAILLDSQSLASQVDLNNSYLPPFANSNYLLGTDGLGRSVAFGLMNGIKISLFVALFTGAISLLVALFFSYLAGYLANDKLHLSKPTIILLIFLSILAIFYLWHSPSIILVLGWIMVCYLLVLFDHTILKNFKKDTLALDSLVMKYVALQKSLPGIFLILFILALTAERSLLNVILIISFARIPALIRLSRSEVLKVKNQEFIKAAESIGIKNFQIFTRHILPNIITPLRTYLIYTMATTILIESTLSFLGLGLSLDSVTLGSMLSNSREYFGAWWLAIFPGSIIFLLIYSIRKLLNQKVESEEYAYL